ncbi:hypothetical protein GCM10011380_09020 [Sphingomonas metalli]|uniref:Uncharacterized protein n=1 Tax=Sphingomonas metalli TaxID=1779358 RepID=A0A916WPB3_9SPHN|nr:hypothetical protein [Sphingomonas metalli]GGB21621.1 hypothetical protein GCM10011380_09020 [Sphingomonas metalli]
MACRICTTNDHESLREKIAGDLWESRRNGHLEDVPWERAPDYWQQLMRQLADAAIESARS